MNKLIFLNSVKTRPPLEAFPNFPNRINFCVLVWWGRGQSTAYAQPYMPTFATRSSYQRCPNPQWVITAPGSSLKCPITDPSTLTFSISENSTKDFFSSFSKSEVGGSFYPVAMSLMVFFPFFFLFCQESSSIRMKTRAHIHTGYCQGYTNMCDRTRVRGLAVKNPPAMQKM